MRTVHVPYMYMGPGPTPAPAPARAPAPAPYMYMDPSAPTGPCTVHVHDVVIDSLEFNKYIHTQMGPNQVNANPCTI